MGKSMPLDNSDKSGLKKSTGFTRGQLARETGCNIETIRYYEKIGLLPDPGRSQAGYRVYAEKHLKQLKFIQHAKSLGFSSEKILSLLHLNSDENEYTRADVKSLTDLHIAEIAAQIRDLKKIKNRLSEISSFCDGSDRHANTCPILESLFDDI